MEFEESFSQYRSFCFEQMKQLEDDKDVKIVFMTKVINNLFDQNETLMSIINETRHSVGGTSAVMNQLLTKSARRTDEVMLALSDYEGDLKTLAGVSLPTIVNYDQLVEQLESKVEAIEVENFELRESNEQLFKDSLALNRQLILYKHLFYLNLYDHPLTHDNIQANITEQSFLGIVRERKLQEGKENVDTIICAHLLDEIIDQVETKTTLDTDHELLDIVKENHALKSTNREDSNNYYDILSMLINELEYQDTVIKDMRQHNTRLLTETRHLKDHQQSVASLFSNFCQRADAKPMPGDTMEIIEQIKAQLGAINDRDERQQTETEFRSVKANPAHLFAIEAH